MKISILTAVKSEKYLIETIYNVQSQITRNRFNIEHIIIYKTIDKSIIESLSQKFPHLKFINQKKNGIYNALNIGMKSATGKILGILHCNDFYVSKWILLAILLKFEKENFDILHGDIYFFNKDNKIKRVWLGQFISDIDILNGKHPPHTSCFYSQNIYCNYFYDEKYKISSDYKYLINILKNKKLKQQYYKKFIVKMSLGGLSTKKINIIKSNIESYRALKEIGMKAPLKIIIKKIFGKIPQI